MFLLNIGKAVVLVGVLGRLISLQINESKKYKTLSDKNRFREWKLAPERGIIKDYFNEEIVGGYFSLFSCIILGLSIITMNLNFIIPGMILFGFGTANFIAVVYRQAIKSSNEPINLTVSNLATLGFAGFIFGPVIVGYMAEYFGLTFNMYVLSVIWAINGLLLLFLMNKNNKKLI